MHNRVDNLWLCIEFNHLSFIGHELTKVCELIHSLCGYQMHNHVDKSAALSPVNGLRRAG